MTIRRFITAVAMASILWASNALSAPKEIVTLILVDAMRPDHMGSYGYTKDTSPNLDKLAKEGTRYTRMYSNAPWTRPSTASFLTGLHASRHQTESAENKMPKSVKTLAHRMKKRGYYTAGFVANGNGGSLGGLHLGFDLFEDPSNTYTRGNRGRAYNGLPTGEFLIDKATTWLEKTNEEKVFLFMFLVDPHDPYFAPERLEKMFLGDYKGKVRRKALWEANNDYPEAERKSMVAVYDAGIRYADEALGTFFSYLKKKDIYEQSTIMVSADHGEGFGEHNFYLHAHHFWDEVVKVPLIVKGPKFKAGAVDERLTSSVDVVQTILDISGGVAKNLPGKSMVQAVDPEHVVISEYNEFGIHRQAIVGPRYKVIWQRPANEKRYLRVAKKKEYFPSVSFDKEVVTVYDLINDPMEKTKIKKNLPDEAKALLKRLKKFVNAAPPNLIEDR